jgi:hypothetical protein
MTNSLYNGGKVKLQRQANLSLWASMPPKPILSLALYRLHISPLYRGLGEERDR